MPGNSELNTSIKMLDLASQYETYKNEIDAAVQNALKSGSYINGPQVREFESNMEQFLAVKHAVGVASGSDALLLSLHALGIGRGDRVIVPTFTFFATAGSVSRLGATPVFVDIDPDKFNLDLNMVEDVLSRDKNIKAIIPVHLFGLPVDMKRAMDLAAKYNVKVIEDACQAINADVQYCGSDNITCKTGTIGHTGCFSFFPSKNLGCYGDGGMVTTNDDDVAKQLRILRVHGSNPKYYHSLIGYNSRLDTLQAAILNVKLKYLDEWTQKRQKVAALYHEAFVLNDLTDKVKWLEPGDGHVYHQYVIEIDNRDNLITHLKRNGIDTSVYYPLPLHLQKCFQELNYREGMLPIAEEACKKVLALPIDPELTESQVNYIVQCIKEFLMMKFKNVKDENS